MEEFGPIRQPAEHVAYNIDPDSLSEFYAWPSDHSNTNFGYRTSYAGSLATNPIPNSNAGGFGLLEPNFYRGHNYPMQSWDLGNECGVDRTSHFFTDSSSLHTPTLYQGIGGGEAQYNPPNDHTGHATTNVAGLAPDHEFLFDASSKVPALNGEASERELSSITMEGKFDCPFQPCSFKYSKPSNVYHQHVKTAHPFAYTCKECGERRSNMESLSRHASRTGHACFVCNNPDCDKTFLRLDTYRRHMKEHLDDVKRFPCKYCKKYRGQNGFKRKDHLTQHLRGYHHIGEGEGKFRYEFPLYDKTFCRHPDCPESQNNWVRRGVAFKKVSDCTTHMKTVHNESDFPCPEPGCDRVGGKGYFRKVDLRRHITKVHGTDDKLVEGEDQ